MPSVGLLLRYAALVAVAALGLALAGLASRGALAVFTSQATVTGNTFTTAASFATATPALTATQTATASATPTTTPTLTATPTPSCAAGDTGFLDATAEAADTGADGNGFEVNPTYAFGNDALYAENINGYGDRHRYYNYGISIGSGCSVAGIEVRLDWWLDSTNGTSSMSVELSWDGGTSWTAAKTDDQETTSEHTITLGASLDGWGRTWSLADFDDANFRVRVTSDSDKSVRDFFLDWVPVRVYYTPP